MDWTWDVVVAGNYAYVAAHTTGLRVISVSDPAHPAEVGSCWTPSYAQGVAQAGSYAYIAALGAGMRVISVADPTQPFEVGFCETPGNAEGVTVAGNLACVADMGAGLRVISVTDPAQPVEVGYYDTPRSANNLAMAGGYVYVAHGAAGLRIFQYYSTGIEEGKSPTAYRSPLTATIARGVLNLGVDSKQHAAYRAELLDISGRRVLELHPGPNDVSRLSPGVYFVWLADGGKRPAVSKVVTQH